MVHTKESILYKLTRELVILCVPIIMFQSYSSWLHIKPYSQGQLLECATQEKKL